MKSVLVAMILASSVAAFAHDNKVVMTSQSIAVAAEQFERDPSMVQAFTGVKGWLDGDQVKVRFYLNNNTSVLYSCHMMSHDIMCTKER